MIPLILHQIWIGDQLKMPVDWMNTWVEKNPKIDVWVWTEKEIDLMGLKNRKLYDEYYSKGEYHGASDVARIEILEKYGGIYMDADSICKEPIENEEFMQSDFFVAYEHQNHPGRIANGVIGSVAGHQILKEYIKRIGDAKKIRPIWNTIGGTMLTKIIEDYGKEKITILPACSFYPVNHNGQVAPIVGKVYAEQLWGTTKGIYKDKKTNHCNGQNCVTCKNDCCWK